MEKKIPQNIVRNRIPLRDDFAKNRQTNTSDYIGVYPGIEEYDLPTCYQLAHAPNKISPCTDCPVAKTLKDGEIHEKNQGIASKQSYAFREIAAPIHDAHGRISGAIQLLEDVTEKHREEKLLRHSKKKESLAPLLLVSLTISITFSLPLWALQNLPS